MLYVGLSVVEFLCFLFDYLLDGLVHSLSAHVLYVLYFCPTAYPLAFLRTIENTSLINRSWWCHKALVHRIDFR